MEALTKQTTVISSTLSRIVTDYLSVRKSSAERAALRHRRRRTDQWRRMEVFYEEQVRQRAMFCLMLSVTVACASFTADRSVWAKERSKYWWDYLVNETFMVLDWLANFRMSQETFVYLCDQLRRSLHRGNTRFRKAISVEQRVAIAIWRLATNAEYRTIGHLFGVSRSSVCGIVNEVCAAIVSQMMHRFICLPTRDKLEEIVAGLRDRWGFPQCAGAVDGTHIPIIAPAEYHADYHNRKGWYSILMQAVVDHSTGLRMSALAGQDQCMMHACLPIRRCLEGRKKVNFSLTRRLTLKEFKCRLFCWAILPIPSCHG